MRLLDSSIKQEGARFQERLSDDGHWKNALLIRCLTRINGLRSLTFSHPKGRWHEKDCVGNCPSRQKVQAYLEWSMLESRSHAHGEATIAREKLWENASMSWPDQSRPYDDQWLAELNEDYTDLFEDRGDHTLNTQSRSKGDVESSDCWAGQTQSSRPIIGHCCQEGICWRHEINRFESWRHELRWSRKAEAHAGQGRGFQ